VKRQEMSTMQPMKILLATDGSAEAAAACRFLRALPLPSGSVIQIVSAVPVPPGVNGHHAPWQTIEVLFEQQEAWAEKAVQEAQELLAMDGNGPLAGVRFETCIPRGDSSSQILQAADTFEADLVVVGAHGLTGLGSFLGSVARSVVKRCRRPVLVARTPGHALGPAQNDATPSRSRALGGVVVATDGSAHARHALQFLSRLPLPEDAPITAVHVVRPQPVYHGLLPGRRKEVERAAVELARTEEERGTELLLSAEAVLVASGRTPRRRLRTGDPATEILRAAEEENADLIVAGARGVSLLEGLLMGSVADRLVKHAPCSVLIVP
jgi:nucleotide-binding universal stress UspA family protein